MDGLDHYTALATSALPHLAAGTWLTVKLTLISIALALAMAFIAGLARLHHHRALRAVVRVYVEVFRGTSLLVQLFWLYFVLPFFGLELEAFTAAVLALGLNYGAYGAEIVRGAVLAVPTAQKEAAVALNFTARQQLFRIVLPQAIPRMLPPFGNTIVELLKGTALVSLITLHDLTFKAQLVRSATYETVEIFTAVLIMYFAIAMLLLGVMRLLEQWLHKQWGLTGR